MSKRHIWRVLAWLAAAIAVVAIVSYGLAPQAWRKAPGGIIALVAVVAVGVVGFVKNVVDIVAKTAPEPAPHDLPAAPGHAEPIAPPGSVFDQRGQSVRKQINVAGNWAGSARPRADEDEK